MWTEIMLWSCIDFWDENLFNQNFYTVYNIIMLKLDLEVPREAWYLLQSYIIYISCSIIN